MCRLKASLVRILACPVCHAPLRFDGETARGRLVRGTLECPEKHLFRLNEEIAALKEAKLSRDEFVWNTEFPDLKKYDRVRRKYRSYLSDRQNEADALLVAEIARKTPREGVVLDIASGMGTLLLALSERSGDQQLLGTDVDETPLRGAMLKLREKKSYGRTSLCVMDAKHLAVKSKSVACVASHFGFNNIPRTRLALSEASRVLKPKGSLVFSALLLREGSRSDITAKKLGYGEIATEPRLGAALGQAGFRVDAMEEFYSGEWLPNPMDQLPLEGDWFAHSLIRAHVR